MAWTAQGGGDHGGADWTISSPTSIAGDHTGVGVFTVSAAATVTGDFSVICSAAVLTSTITGAHDVEIVASNSITNNSTIDTSGGNGGDGADDNGADGSHGSNGTNGSDGADNFCANGGAGQPGTNGTSGQSGGDGGTGGNGNDGVDAGSVVLTAGAILDYGAIVADGGDGGNGGNANGGTGGNGGVGGDGGNGGDCTGSSCEECGNGGDGGDGGNSGNGGNGGDGGVGGDGGNGGNGGNVVLTGSVVIGTSISQSGGNGGSGGDASAGSRGVGVGYGGTGGSGGAGCDDCGSGAAGANGSSSSHGSNGAVGTSGSGGGGGTDGSTTTSYVSEVDFSEPVGEHINLFVKIDGLEPILWQYSHLGQPAGWSRSIIACLRAGEESSADIDLATMRTGMSAMTFELEDHQTADDKSYFGQLFAPGKYAVNPCATLKEGTEYHQIVASDDTTIPVNGDGANLSSGLNYIGQETIYVGTAAADSLTDVDRGRYPCVGTEFARAYSRPQSGEAGYLQTISGDPYSWVGHRIALYAIQWDETTEAWAAEANASLLWVGRISDRIVQSGEDRSWRLSCTSVLQDLANKKIASSFPTSTLEQYINLMGDVGRTFRIKARGVSSPDVYTWYSIEVPKNIYTHTSLAQEITQQISLSGLFGDYGIMVTMAMDQSGKKWRIGLGGPTPTSSGAYVTLQWSDDHGYPCHATQALGMHRGVGRVEVHVSPTVVTGHAGVTWIDGVDSTCVAYQPLHHQCHGALAYPVDPERFWADQGDNDTAFACVRFRGSRMSAIDDTKRDCYVAYTARTWQALVLDTDYRNNYHKERIQLDAYVAQRIGDEPAEIEQVYIPRYITDGDVKRYPFEMLLYLLLSTGSQNGYNHSTYDKAPLSMSVGVQASLVDVDSFVNADIAIKNFSTATRFPYVIDEPITFEELLLRECRLFGYALVWRDGKLTLRNILSPAFDRATEVINSSTGDIADEWPDCESSTDTVVNEYRIKCGYDATTGDYAYNVVISDVASIVGLEVTRAAELEHPGILVPDGVAPADVLHPFFADRWLRYPNPVVSVRLDHTKVNSIFVGDTVAFISDRINEPSGGGSYETSCYATVLGVRWSYGNHLYSGSATLLLHPLAIYLSPLIFVVPDDVQYVQMGQPWSPSALVDRAKDGGTWNNGWDSTNYQLALEDVYYGATGDTDDGARFGSGQAIRVVERAPADPSSPQEWGPIDLASDYETDGAGILTLANGTTLAGWDGDREYVVEYADYGDLSTDQYKSGTWQADASTRLLDSSKVAQRYA